MSPLRKHLRGCLLLLLGSPLYLAAAPLTLNDAIDYAERHEPWLEANRLRQSALEAKSISSGSLPDPVLSLTLANLPTDGFAFNQEAMTQFKLGVSQQFGRGDSLALKRRQIEQTAEAMPFERENRLAWVRAQVAEFWFNAFRAQRSIELIEEDKIYFRQLLELSEASYGASLGGTRQQDIIRAQLELTRLDDKLTRLAQMLAQSKKRLIQWLPYEMLESELDSNAREPVALADFAALSDLDVMKMLAQHPSVLALAQREQAFGTAVDVAREGYKPRFGVNLSYGYRADTPVGDSRADLLSVGLNMDLPLFNDNRQDQDVKAAIAEFEASKTDRQVFLQQLKGQFMKERSQLASLDTRAALYRDTLLPQMAEQVAATLNAYTHDTGDFSDVMRARIAELDAKLDALNIRVDRAILLARLNYYAAGKGVNNEN